MGHGRPGPGPAAGRGPLRPLLQPGEHHGRVAEEPGDRRRDDCLHQFRQLPGHRDAGGGRALPGLRLVGIERIGLRYVLEIRVPAGVDGRIEWTNWIDESLLGPQRLAPGGLLLTEWQGAAVYREAQPGKSLIVRYGPGVGQALDAQYHLRRVTPVQAGQFFLMDIDSFWTPPTGAIPEYNREALVSTYRESVRPGADGVPGHAHQPSEGRAAAHPVEPGALLRPLRLQNRAGVGHVGKRGRQFVVGVHEAVGFV